ncbi:hypothetical protein OSB04_016343 [Centaurea solstitialis]|uniref:Myb/SANT-like domain-containing protein n=1 Tax=Centaurea solstitialis TaxID=347529 RepID=A0AA38T0T2_9ASTR|nr:hypothetical protein OSB04_016343 [Centaurea solstitialis]
MFDKTKKVIDKKQLKNKRDNMKKDWKLYHRLMRHETGIGGTRSLIEASPEWWEEKIKENKEYAKFRDTDLRIYETHYGPLFRDSVAIGDQTMTPGQFQNNSNLNDGQSQENGEGKGDSDEINLDEDEALFPSFPDRSSSKRKNGKGVANSRSTKSKTSAYMEKLDVIMDAISLKSTKTSAPNNPTPTLVDCMNITKKFPGFNEGSKEYSKALFFFTNKNNREAFMFPTTDEAKMDFLKMNSDDSDSSYDENEEYSNEDDIEFRLLCRLAVQGILLGCNIRMPCQTLDRTRHMFVDEILNGHPRRCYELFRLEIPILKCYARSLLQITG